MDCIPMMVLKRHSSVTAEQQTQRALGREEGGFQRG